MSTLEEQERARFEESLQRRVGTLLGNKYKLEALLGAGGMAAVYRATHRNGNRVAVKMLHPEVAVLPEIRARFLREGYVANGVEHPGVVRVIDDDVTPDGAVYLVMDLLDGKTLGQLLDERRTLSAAEAVPMIVEVLDVLVAAHARGVVHRDIKPENVFIVRDGSMRLLDFGIARVTSATSATRTGHLMGTPAYMAPEQARGLVKQIDARTDLWAVGAVLFRMLTGRQVHVADTPELTVVHAATKCAPPLTELAPDAGAALAAVVDRALAVEMADRWPDARSMQDALKAVSAAGLSSVAQMAALSSGALDRTHPMTPVTPSTPPHTRPMEPVLVPGSGTTPGIARSGPPPAERSGSRAAVVGLAMLAVAILGAGSFGLRKLVEDEPVQKAAPATPESAPLPAPAVSTEIVAAGAATPARSALPLLAMPDAGHGHTATTPSPVKPVSLVSPPKASASARPAASASTTAPVPSPSCTPPYTLDASGNKIWKAECFK